MEGRRKSAVAAFLLLLSGCAGSVAWDEHDATHERFVADSAACREATPRNGYFGSGIGASPTMSRNIDEAYERCMRGLGYVSHTTH